MLKANILEGGDLFLPYRAHFIMLKIKNVLLHIYTYRNIEYLVKYLGLSNLFSFCQDLFYKENIL